MTIFADIEFKNLESQQALLKIRTMLEKYNNDEDIKRIIANIDNINLQWVIGSIIDCGNINEKIRMPIINAHEKNNETTKEKDLFDCLLVLTYYWPLNTFNEDENSFECPITKLSIDEADRIVFPSGTQLHRSTLNEYLVDAMSKGFKDPITTRFITGRGVAALIAQHPPVAAEVCNNPRLAESKNDYIHRDFAVRVKSIVKIAFAIGIIFIIAPAIITFSPVATIIASLIVMIAPPAMVLISTLYSAYKASSLFAATNSIFEKIAQGGDSFIQTFKDAITHIKENTIAINLLGQQEPQQLQQLQQLQQPQPDLPSANVAINILAEEQQGTTAAIVQQLNLQQAGSCDAQPDKDAQHVDVQLLQAVVEPEEEAPVMTKEAHREAREAWLNRLVKKIASSANEPVETESKSSFAP